MLPIIVKATLWWFLILVLAILNGALRQGVLIPALGSFAGLFASGVLLSGCVVLVAYAGAPWYAPMSPAGYWLVGGYWLVLTLIFEFGFGYYAEQKPLRELFRQYTFEGGNLWPLVLVVVLVSPWLTAKIRGLI